MLRYLLGLRAGASRRERARGSGTGRGTAGALGSLAFAVLLGAAPGALALGLGDIELDSALNEKLDARIDLMDADGLQPAEIIVSLASPEDFERVGVERFFFLTDLRFELDYVGQRVRNVKVTSTQPVTEPYLNFLVEVLWPNGRMLKEYTLLLDPPTFSPAAAPGVAAPAQDRQRESGAGRVDRAAGAAASTRGTRVQLAPGAAVPSPLDEGVVDGEYRMTDRNDTLWRIAMRTRPSQKVSVQQYMLAIQRLNPQAFLNDNINLVKAGYSLRLPTEQEALAVDGGEAIRQVAMQNEDWRALRRGEPVPERARQQVAEASDTSEPALQARVDATPARADTGRAAPASSGELRIVAGAADGAAAASVVDAEELDAAQEERDRLSREVQSLTQDLEREKELARNQVAVKERQLEVKDQQIAEMRAELARLRAEMERAEESAGQSQNQSPSGSEAWWQSSYVLGGAAGVVVLLLVYGLIAARRRRAEQEDFYPQMEAPAAPTVAPAAVGSMPDFDDDDELVDETPAAVTAVADAADDETTSETSDVIGEADIYIAYGRYPQAIGLLLGVLEEDPGRNDVRLKLLELYAETRDREAFEAHLAELVARCNDEEALLAARELEAQFGDESANGAAARGARKSGGDEIDLDALAADDATETEELDLGNVAPPAAAKGGAAPEADDFELELDDLVDEPPARQTGGNALGGDLGIDFDPDRGNGQAEGRRVSADADDELDAGDDLDLDLDLDDADVLGDEEFDLADEGDTASTKLDLARAYIDMGDQDGARDILNEVVVEGNTEQKQRATAMLEEL